MNTQIEIPPKDPVIVMSRTYDAPRDLLWRVMTDPAHVTKWWGGPGAKNAIKEMDVRPGGLWTHHMTFPNGDGVQMNFVFTEVDKPARLGWKHIDYDTRKDGPPPIHIVVTLDALAKDKTKWTMVARFPTLAGRDQSVEFGFTKPIAASSDLLVDYLKTVEAAPMISMHAMAVESMVPLLTSLSECLDKGEAHAKANGLDLINARLAPDMFTLAQQVQQACHYVNDGLSRLTAAGPTQMPEPEATFAGLKSQIAGTIAKARAVPVAALKGAEDRDCSIEIPGNMVIALTGLTMLRAWTLPHFYFHVVTAYDILRQGGVQIGKRDYLSQIGPMIRPR